MKSRNRWIARSIAMLVAVALSGAARADENLGNVGNTFGNFSVFVVNQYEPLQDIPAEEAVSPPLPAGFEYSTDVDFYAKMSNLTDIFSDISLSAGSPARFGELANGEYGVVQDVIITYTGSGSVDFTDVLIVFDFFENNGDTMGQMAPSADPEGDFDMVRFISGPPVVYEGARLPVGFVDQDVPFGRVVDPVDDTPLRGWRLTPVGTLSTGQSAEITWVLGTGVLVECTAEGTDIAVQPIDFATGDTPVTVTFDTVTQQGQTTLEITNQGAPPPFGFKLGAPPMYYEIATTATFTGVAEICIDYSDVSYGNEAMLGLFHLENGEWVDVTTSLDTGADIVCGEVTSFSPFAVFEALETDGDGVLDFLDCQPESDFGEFVVIDGCDSGVDNVLLDDGCTILDLIWFCAEEADNHGQFVSCVTHLTNELRQQGIITNQEKAAIQSCAAQANIP